MIIRRYGIELHRVTHGDIELIRENRNRDGIRRHMFEQDHISSEQQEEWFQSIDNMFNFFFLIGYQDRYIGLLQGKNIDYETRENEGGIFIWENSLLGTGIPARASICLMEANFSMLLMQRVYARVRKDNIGAWQYNLSLGYMAAPDKGEDYMILSKETYEREAARLRWLASGKKDAPPFSTINDTEIPDANQYRYLYEDLPEDILSVFGPKLLKPNGWL